MACGGKPHVKCISGLRKTACIAFRTRFGGALYGSRRHTLEQAREGSISSGPPPLARCANMLHMTKKNSAKHAHQEGPAAKTPSAKAGEFVREEIELIRHGAHGARSAKQAIAIGLSKARRAGVNLPPPKRGSVSEETRTKALRDTQKAKSGNSAPKSRKRSQATLKALKREGSASVSERALSQQAKAAARNRTPAERTASAKKAARTRAANR